MPRPVRITARKKPIAARCLWLLAACATGLSARTLGPDEAVRRALSRPDIETRAAASVAEARSDVTAARTWPNPELAIEQERGRGAIAYSTETSLVLSQTLDFSGRRGLERRAAELGVQATETQVRADRARIRADVLRHYFDAAAAQQGDVVLGEIATALAELRRVAARRQDAGDLSGFESQRIDQAATRMELRRAQQRARLAAARERLAAWVGPQARTAKLQLDALPADLVTADTGAPAAARLDALRARADAADARAQAAARLPIPVTVGIGQKRFETAQARDDALIVQASVPLPIFDRGRAGRERARAQADAAHAGLAIAEREVEARRAAALAEAALLEDAARRYRHDVLPQARRLSRIATASFAEGELDLVGLLETLDAQAEAAEETTDLTYRARLARLDLLDPPIGDVP